jgi:hypothetical protein
MTPGPDIEKGWTYWGWWGASKPAKAVPGIDLVSIEDGLWNGDMVFALWIDRKPLDNHSFGQSGSRPEAKWFALLSNPPKVDFECRTTDGTTGLVTVNGKAFDLADGR